MYGQTGDRLVYGNPLGLELIAVKDRVNSRLDALEAESIAHRADITAHRADIVAHQAEITALKEEAVQHQICIQHLTAACERYLKIR